MLRRIILSSILLSSLFVVSFTSVEGSQCQKKVKKCETFTKCNKNPCEMKSTRNVTLFQKGRVRDDENQELAYAWPSLRDGELSDQLSR